MKTEEEIKKFLESVKVTKNFMDQMIDVSPEEFPDTEEEKKDFHDFFQGIGMALRWVLAEKK